jgi:hypothetical protein
MGRLLRWLEATGLLLWVCGLGASAVTAGRTTAHREAHGLYLPAAGPSPLRFQSPRPASRLVFPPLPLPHCTGARTDASPTNSAPPVPTPALATNRPVSAVHVTGPSPVPAPSQPIEGLPSPSAPEDQTPPAAQGLDSRLLLEYLAPLPTNRPARNELSSPAFVPPVAPAPARSSQATYESR